MSVCHAFFYRTCRFKDEQQRQQHTKQYAASQDIINICISCREWCLVISEKLYLLQEPMICDRPYIKMHFEILVHALGVWAPGSASLALGLGPEAHKPGDAGPGAMGTGPGGPGPLALGLWTPGPGLWSPGPVPWAPGLSPRAPCLWPWALGSRPQALGCDAQALYIQVAGHFLRLSEAMDAGRQSLGWDPMPQITLTRPPADMSAVWLCYTADIFAVSHSSHV